MGETGVPSTIALAGGVEIELLARGDRFLGLGRVTVAGVALRSGRRPMCAEIATPTGVRLRDHRLTAARPTAAGGVVLDVATRLEAGGRRPRRSSRAAGGRT